MSKMATTDEMATDGADCVVVSSTIIGLPKVFFVEAARLDVDLRCTEIRLDL